METAIFLIADEMRITEFLANFEDDEFPSQFGPWCGKDSFDPSFTETQLKEMEKRGIIDRDVVNNRFRLTMKATAVRNSERDK